MDIEPLTIYYYFRALFVVDIGMLVYDMVYAAPVDYSGITSEEIQMDI